MPRIHDGWDDALMSDITKGIKAKNKNRKRKLRNFRVEWEANGGYSTEYRVEVRAFSSSLAIKKAIEFFPEQMHEVEMEAEPYCFKITAICDDEANPELSHEKTPKIPRKIR